MCRLSVLKKYYGHHCCLVMNIIDFDFQCNHMVYFLLAQYCAFQRSPIYTCIIITLEIYTSKIHQNDTKPIAKI